MPASESAAALSGRHGCFQNGSTPQLRASKLLPPELCTTSITSMAMTTSAIASSRHLLTADRSACEPGLDPDMRASAWLPAVETVPAQIEGKVGQQAIACKLLSYVVCPRYLVVDCCYAFALQDRLTRVRQNFGASSLVACSAIFKLVQAALCCLLLRTVLLALGKMSLAVLTSVVQPQPLQ